MLFVTLLGRSWKLILNDRVLLLLSFIPLIIGTVLYSVMGTWLYKLVMNEGRDFIQDRLGDGTGASVLYYALILVFTVLLFFLVNFTFVLIVSVLASPFNDWMSSRVEKKHYGITAKEIPGNAVMRILGIVWNELKKITLILFLTLISMVISFIPVLAPVTIFLSAVLLAIQFLDYSWARHEWKSGACVRDVLNNLLPYGLGGAIFVVLMSIPGVNLLALPLGVVYFTCFWLEKNQSKLKQLETANIATPKLDTDDNR